MQLTVISVAAVLVASVAALPSSVNYVIHEKRSGRSDWAPQCNDKPDGGIRLPVKIGLMERNIPLGDQLLMNIANPSSKDYGKHMAPEEIAQLFAPDEASTNAIRDWLSSSGIVESRIRESRGKNWLTFDASITELEDLLKTEYRIYTHGSSGQEHIACEEYSVPQDLSMHLDLIMPTVHFDSKIVTDPAKQKDKRNDGGKLLPGLPSDPWIPKKGPIIKGPGAQPNAQQPQINSLSNCNSQITPDCLRALYSFPNGTLQKSSYGIVEYTPQAYLQADLNMFYSYLAKHIPNNTAPRFDSVDGGVDQTTNQGFNYNGESDLDLEYAIALVYPQKVNLYQVGDLVEGASFNNFLDALDASYCISGGGDNPSFDGIYPDSYSANGYKKEDCGRYSAPAVISTSYGFNEADLTTAYERRQCNEYMKLGLAGTTVIYSSGDYGVAGNGGQCCAKAKCAGGSYNDGSSGAFNPSFPGTCPYVTSVGATQIAPGASVTAPEQACGSVIYSGGGFSNRFPMPSYQSWAMKNYFSHHNPKYTTTQYNNSQAVRGYPDVAANGANYVVAVDGTLTLVFGTSASAPTFGSIITLINEQRANSGKKSVGFINPTLYANPTMMNDITAGGNPGCGTAGFSAVAGWDPVTGLGTPNYEKMLSVFMKLS